MFLLWRILWRTFEIFYRPHLRMVERRWYCITAVKPSPPTVITSSPWGRGEGIRWAWGRGESIRRGWGRAEGWQTSSSLRNVSFCEVFPNLSGLQCHCIWTSETMPLPTQRDHIVTTMKRRGYRMSLRQGGLVAGCGRLSDLISVLSWQSAALSSFLLSSQRSTGAQTPHSFLSLSIV